MLLVSDRAPRRMPCRCIAGRRGTSTLGAAPDRRTSMRTVSLRARRASLAGTLVVMALSAVSTNPVHAAAVDALGPDVDIAGGDAVDRVDCTSGGVTPGNNRCDATAD